MHVDDIVDLILRIFEANGHQESRDNIKEWFCDEAMIDFWSFFSQLAEKYIGLLQIHIVQEVHQAIVSEVLKEGKLEKKGHVVHNWKTRWFVLTNSALTYFESRDNMLLKVSNMYSYTCAFVIHAHVLYIHVLYIHVVYMHMCYTCTCVIHDNPYRVTDK